MSETLYRANVLVCGGTSCDASGSAPMYETMVQELAKRDLSNEVHSNIDIKHMEMVILLLLQST